MIGLRQWCLIIAVSALGCAQASVVTFNFSGIVNGLPPELGANAAIGDVVSGRYSFETTTPDSAADPQTGLYFNAGTSFVMTVGAFTYTSNAVDIVVSNLAGVDIYRVTGSNVIGAPTNAGYTPSFFTLDLTDNISASALTSDALPLTPPNLSAFNINQLTLTFLPPAGVQAPASGTARLTGLTLGDTPVPTPGIAILLAAGLLALRRVV